MLVAKTGRHLHREAEDAALAGAVRDDIDIAAGFADDLA